MDTFLLGIVVLLSSILFFACINIDMYYMFIFIIDINNLFNTITFVIKQSKNENKKVFYDTGYRTLNWDASSAQYGRRS